MNKRLLLVSVEAIQVNDYQQWLPFWLKYQEFYKVSISEETTLATWNRFLITTKKIIV